MKFAKLLSVSVLAIAAMPALANAGNCNQTPSCQSAPAPAPVASCDQSNACGTSVPLINNEQYQEGNIYARVRSLVNYSEGGQYNGAAAGNAFSSRSQEQGVVVNSLQRVNGNVGAFNKVSIGEARGLTMSNAVAQGNAGQIEANYGNTYVNGQQVTEYGSNVSAKSHVNVGSSDYVVSNAQTAGNNWATASNNAYVESAVGQYNSANVRSSSVVTACCNNGSVTSSALATGNTNSIVGTGSTIYSAFEQKNYGPVSARAIILNGSATDNLASATAVANNTTLTNDWGYAQSSGYQENNSAVNAHSLVLNDDFIGSAVSNASAMGNSALVSNIGSDARLDIGQNNFGGGAISATANLVGASSHGGVGVATSYAAGNSITGYACDGCAGGGVSIQGNSAQYNYAPVSATTNINMGTAGMIIGSATAIGNSATYITQRGHN